MSLQTFLASLAHQATYDISRQAGPFQLVEHKYWLFRISSETAGCTTDNKALSGAEYARPDVFQCCACSGMSALQHLAMVLADRDMNEAAVKAQVHERLCVCGTASASMRAILSCLMAFYHVGRVEG